MGYWVQKIQRINKVAKLSIPKAWILEYLEPDERYLMIVDNGDGTLTINPLRKWQSERTIKNTVK